jgi:hypothetical protein
MRRLRRFFLPEIQLKPAGGPPPLPIKKAIDPARKIFSGMRESAVFFVMTRQA